MQQVIGDRGVHAMVRGAVQHKLSLGPAAVELDGP
jgi:hypothetical protein